MIRLLSPIEEAYLNGTKDFTRAQQRYIRYRLKKKLRLLEVSRDAAAAALLRLSNDNNNNNDLVAQPAERGFVFDNERKNRSPSRDLNPGRPLSVLLGDLRFTKPSLLNSNPS